MDGLFKRSLAYCIAIITAAENNLNIPLLKSFVAKCKADFNLHIAFSIMYVYASLVMSTFSRNFSKSCMYTQYVHSTWFLHGRTSILG